MWLSSMCGLSEIVNPQLTHQHLKAVHQYNLKSDLSDYPNPQRVTYANGKEAGLLMCTWPKGDKLSLPFVYSSEVWTGVEYQVAGHLMTYGEVEKGLDIVKGIRGRYDGKKRNPFDEYEYGHWYGRALASYGMLQGLTGVRYDAVDQVLYIDSKVGDNFVSFLSTSTGFGNVGLRDGKPFVDVKNGKIEIKEIINNSK